MIYSTGYIGIIHQIIPSSSYFLIHLRIRVTFWVNVSSLAACNQEKRWTLSPDKFSIGQKSSIDVNTQQTFQSIQKICSNDGKCVSDTHTRTHTNPYDVMAVFHNWKLKIARTTLYNSQCAEHINWYWIMTEPFYSWAFICWMRVVGTAFGKWVVYEWRWH